MSRIIAPATAFALLLGACATTVSPPSGTARTAAVTRPATTSVLTAEDAALIRAYYGSQDHRGGKGRGRGGALPPGIAKNLARGKPLPPGIAKQYLPSELLRSLPPAGQGLEYVMVAGKLLLVEAATQIVREVLLETVFG